MARSNLLVDPYNMNPPEEGVIFVNDKGTCIMSRTTFAKAISERTNDIISDDVLYDIIREWQNEEKD